MKKELRKILIIADGYPTDNNVFTGIFVKEQIEEMRKQYPDIVFDLYFNPFFKIFSQPEKKQSKFWNALKWGMQLLCFTPYLFKNYDLVHAHRFFLPVLNGAVYKIFRRKPLIATSHGIKQIQNRYNKKWVKALFHYCDLVITVNNSMKLNFVKYFNIPESKVRVRSCGIDFKAFNNYEKTIIHKKEENIFTLGFVGDMSEVKKPYYFIQCIQALTDKYPIKGIMVGGGSRLPEIRKYIIENNLPIEVKGTLPRREVISLFYQFDIFIFPSSIEPFGLVGIEALYCNIPIVASAVGGKTDYIINGKNGLLFEKDNLKDLINKTELLLNDESMREKFKNAGRLSIENYSNEKVAKEIVNYYHNIIGKS